MPSCGCGWLTAAIRFATVRAELAQRAVTGTTSPATLFLVASPDQATRAALGELHRTITATGRCGIAVVTTVSDGGPIGPAMLTVTDARPKRLLDA